MKKIIGSIFCCLLMISCAVNESIRARQALEKCEYKLVNFHLQAIEFSDSLLLENGTKLAWKNSSQLLSHLPEVLGGNFSIPLKSVVFNAEIEITNHSEYLAALDSLQLQHSLNGENLFETLHLQYLEIPKNKMKRTNVRVSFPPVIDWSTLSDAQEYSAEGKVWWRLYFLENHFVTLPLPISFSEKIPRKQITEELDAFKLKLVKDLKNSNLKDFNSLKNKLKSLF